MLPEIREENKVCCRWRLRAWVREGGKHRHRIHLKQSTKERAATRFRAERR